MESYQVSNSLKPFFEPKSVAIIGASRTPEKAGYNIVENLLRLGYGGDIYPVNPEAKKILGLSVYATIKDTPKKPELAIITVPPSLVLPVFKECLERGTKGVIIVSSGFAEISDAGALMEKEIVRMARESGVRVIGPNSMGIVNSSSRFISSFGRLSNMLPPGGVLNRGSAAVVGQTGLLPVLYLPLLNLELEISIIAHIGNKCDVDESDLLEYLADDPKTRVIAMHLESIKDGRRFIRLSQRVVREKPIIVLKTAVTESGARASATHTASIAGEDRVYDAAFKQSGIIRVADFDQLFDVTKAFIYLPLPKGNRVAIISITGAGCVIAADACAKEGLKIAELSAETIAKAATVYPDWWQVRNPLDVWTAIETSGFKSAYNTLTRAALEDEGVDAAVVIVGAVDRVPLKVVARLFGDIKKEFPEKPFLIVNMLGDRGKYQQICQGFKSLSIPTYTGAEGAVVALAALWRYQQYRSSAD